MDEKQQYFDSIGDDWDRDLTAEDLERLSHIIDKVDIKPGINVCDLGCGTGVLFDLLRRRVGEDGFIVGVDFAPRVAHKAHSNFPFHNVGVIEADVCCMPFQDNAFDLVISFAAFAHFSHKDETIRQANMMLKPGGRIIIIHLHGRTDLAKMHHQVGGPIDRDELPSPDELKDMFDRGHFTGYELTDTKDLYLAIGFKEK
jgi:demethylmenaquinone methyltransferase/2-methoxy-6-polyprenyl-1,4-benzoquinol methylase